MAPVQQDLFATGEPQAAVEALDAAEELAELVALLNEWSYSRREAFEKCQRLYYYLYHGASARLAKSDPQKERLKFLKNLTNRHMRAGDLMHLAIRCSLKGREKGREWSPAFLVEFARKKFQEDLAFSRGYQEGTGIPENGPALLMEVYYGVAGAEALWREVEEKLVTALRNYHAPAYSVFRAGVDGGQAKIEVPVSFKLKEVRLRGKVDLAYNGNARATVVDWKMGQGEGGEDSLQLLFYALWAIEAFGREPDHVDLYKAYLGSGTSSRFDFAARSVWRAKGRISQDVERMRAVDGYGRDGLVEAFSPCSQERICAACVFQGICPKE